MLLPIFNMKAFVKISCSELARRWLAVVETTLEQLD